MSRADEVFEAARAAMLACYADCADLDEECHKLGRRITEANRAFNHARSDYLNAVVSFLPGLTLDVPEKPSERLLLKAVVDPQPGLR